MGIVAALGRLGGPIDGADRAAGRFAVGGDRDVAGRKDGDVTVLEVDDLAGMGEDGGDVAGEEILVLAQPDDERGAPAGAEEVAGQAAMDHGDGVGAPGLARGGQHGVGQELG